MNEGSASVPPEVRGAQLGQAHEKLTVPFSKCAFDHIETRAVWEKAWRKAKRRIRIWHSLYVLSWVAYVVYFPNAASKVEEQRAAGLIVVASFIYLAIFYLHRDRKACLKRIRRVLEEYPWQFVPEAHRLLGVRDGVGVPVQVRYREGEEQSGVMSARDPLRRYRWPEGLEHGAWYAGEQWQPGGIGARGFAVLTVPGGGELMELSRRAGAR
ncbi:hypothetical protein ABZT17_30685 [Streptomyces sp. NPDC005648]|uniref:hypothetical protein n=1 Tax=Streptomyces sp. NPDC005648 TaxID=3157044 RepID=UPI0033A73812